MTEKYHNRVIEFECNGCGNVLRTDKNHMRQAVKSLREHKWRYHNKTPNRSFKHYCKRCR